MFQKDSFYRKSWFRLRNLWLLYWGAKFESSLCHLLLWCLFCGILHSVHAKASVEPQGRPHLLPSTHFPIHVSLIIPRIVIVHANALVAIVTLQWLRRLYSVSYQSTEDPYSFLHPSQKLHTHQLRTSLNGTFKTISFVLEWGPRQHSG
jgi:hypothetical protein